MAQAQRAAMTAVAGCVLLLAIAVAWAASIGPGQVLTGEGPGRYELTATPSPTETSPTAQATQPPAQRPAGDTPWLFGVLALLLVLFMTAVLLGAVALVLRHLLALRRDRRVGVADEVGFEVLEAPARVADAVLADAVAQRAELETGLPRNAIVRCWERFEAQGAGAGLPRQGWETSSEYALRILDLVDADAGAVARLAALFREARFSEHELAEADRRRALDALDTIHEGLRLARAGRAG